MTWPDGFSRLNAVFLVILLSFTFQGAYFELVVSPVGPTVVNAPLGSNVTLAVSFSGASDPVVAWFMGRLPVATWVINSSAPPVIAENNRGVLDIEPDGSLTFVNVTLDYTSEYTVEMTKSGLPTSSTSFSLTVFERPKGSPMCSVQSVNNVNLQYHCRWLGGTPQAQLSFPALSNTSSGAGNFNLTVTPSDNLDGKTVTCIAYHLSEQNKQYCNITASSPVKFLPSMRTTVDSSGKIVVTIQCVSEASPKAVVSWLKGNETVTKGTTYQISRDTTQLQIEDKNVNNFAPQNYTCTCRNPLGSQRRVTQLMGKVLLFLVCWSTVNIKEGCKVSKRSTPDVPLLSNAFQLLGDPKAFPGQMRYVIPPLQHVLGLPWGPGGILIRYPNNAKEQQLYSELPLDVGAPYPISKSESSHPTEETHFGHL